MEMADVERRLRELELRVGTIEGFFPAVTPDLAKSSSGGSTPGELLGVHVSNKVLRRNNPNAGQFQDTVWFDCLFTLSVSSKPTRAIKGTYEFCDIFGDPKFLIEYTLNDQLLPGKPFRVQGIGFECNEFMPDHQWVMNTDLSHMTVRFRVQQVMYTDGSSEQIS